MPFAREKDFDEVRNDAELVRPAVVLDADDLCRKIGLLGLGAAGDEQPVENTLPHLGKREVRERAAHVSAQIAVLQAPGQNLAEAGAGHEPEVAESGHRLGQAPIGDGHAHSALDDLGFSDLHLSVLIEVQQSRLFRAARQSITDKKSLHFMRGLD